MRGKPLFVCSDCLRARSHATIQRVRATRDVRRSSSVAERHGPLHLAVIGSGPAGFYTAYRLLKNLPDARVDMYEKLPSPYGLARFGIAPDHPEAKRCSETLVDVAKFEGFKYIGNTPIGDTSGSLPLTSIAPHYDAILFAYGTSKDKKLGIPGENLRNVLSARDFVGWYNGLPEQTGLDPNLTAGETAVVIGQGNVALDVARMLLSPLNELRKTDISEQAVEVLSKSRVKNVKIIGRRGPLQAPYTIRELRELMTTPGLAFSPPPEGWDDLMQVDRKKLPRQLRRIAELLQNGSKTALADAAKAWQLGFLRSPLEFLSSNGTDLSAIGFELMQYREPIASRLTTTDPQRDLNAVRSLGVNATGDKALIHTSLAFNSVGYLSLPLPGFMELGIPFDASKSTIPSDLAGRIISRSAEEPTKSDTVRRHLPGMYCAGWVKRGPTGVIASTLDDAFIVADAIVQDWKENARFNAGVGERKAGWDAIEAEAQQRGIRTVSWHDWERIDAEEVRRGHEKGKEREKFSTVAAMLQVLDG